MLVESTPARRFAEASTENRSMLRQNEPRRLRDKRDHRLSFELNWVLRLSLASGRVLSSADAPVEAGDGLSADCWTIAFGSDFRSDCQNKAAAGSHSEFRFSLYATESGRFIGKNRYELASLNHFSDWELWMSLGSFNPPETLRTEYDFGRIQSAADTCYPQLLVQNPWIQSTLKSEMRLSKEAFVFEVDWWLTSWQMHLQSRRLARQVLIFYRRSDGKLVIPAASQRCFCWNKMRLKSNKID